jgi:hypothetical protein
MLLSAWGGQPQLLGVYFPQGIPDMPVPIGAGGMPSTSAHATDAQRMLSMQRQLAARQVLAQQAQAASNGINALGMPFNDMGGIPGSRPTGVVSMPFHGGSAMPGFNLNNNNQGLSLMGGIQGEGGAGMGNLSLEMLQSFAMRSGNAGVGPSG